VLSLSEGLLALVDYSLKRNAALKIIETSDFCVESLSQKKPMTADLIHLTAATSSISAP
jgi:hypothetical protein